MRLLWGGVAAEGTGPGRPASHHVLGTVSQASPAGSRPTEVARVRRAAIVAGCITLYVAHRLLARQAHIGGYVDGALATNLRWVSAHRR